MEKIYKRYICMLFLVLTISLFLTQILFAETTKNNIKEGGFGYWQDEEISKDPQQQQGLDINSIINQIISAGTNLISGGLGGSRRSQGQCLSKRSREEFLNIITTLPRVTTNTQGYACIPQETYDATLDSLSKIFLEIVGSLPTDNNTVTK